MTTTLAARISASLREQIITGALTPSERLPSENALAREYGVSRAVVREAIGRLRAEGLVRSTRGSGTYVLAVPLSAYELEHHGVRLPSDGTSLSPELTSQTAPVRPDPVTLLEARLALEPYTAALAAERRTAADLSVIEEAMAAVGLAGTHASESLQADYRFHRAIADASGNPYIVGALIGLGPAMIGMPAPRIIGDSGHARTVADEHQVIVDAIRARDTRTASTAMSWHLTRSLRDLK